MTAAERAHELMQSAHRLIAAGSWAEGAETLEEAASAHRVAGRPHDEARCLQLAATLRRAGGDPARARALADRAAAVAGLSASDVPADLPLAVSIAAEQAQTAFDQGRFPESLKAWTQAIDAAYQAGAKPAGLSALLRQRAAARAASSATDTALDGASADFEQAARLLASSGDSGAEFVRVQHAALLAQHGRHDQANTILDSIDTGADAHLRAETFMQRSKIARAGRRFDEASAHARAARDAALEAVAPVSYFAAAGELAQSLDAKGDRAGAYGALATAWATLADLLGEGVARSWAAPVLTAYKFKWSDDAFAKARQAYESQRRSEMEKGRNA